MKRNKKLALGIIAAGVLAARIMARDQVYAQGAFCGGTGYMVVCSTTFPFAPNEYKMTEISWRETGNGLTIIDIGHKPEPGDVSRQTLEVECGSEIFYIQMDSGPATRFKSSDGPPVIKGAGDLAPVVTQCAANRGGHTATNLLPVVQASWTSGLRTNEDIFILEGDHFTEIQNLLDQAYGKPDAAIHSAWSAGGKCRSIYYSPAQIGVLLSLADNWDGTTIVSIIGKQKP